MDFLAKYYYFLNLFISYNIYMLLCCKLGGRDAWGDVDAGGISPTSNHAG